MTPGIFSNSCCAVDVPVGLAEDVAEPGRGAHLLKDVEVLVADHVRDDEGLDAIQSAVGVLFGGKVTGAVEGVRSRPLSRVVGRVRNSLFAVVEDEPDRVAIRPMCAEVLA
jgi:hypothetical protein